MLTTSDFKKGLRVELDGQPWTVVKTKSQSPSARGAATLIKARLKHVLNGRVIDKTFKAGDKFNEPDLQFLAAQYLYKDSESYHFMNMKSYDQFELRDDVLGDDVKWLSDNLEVKAVVFNDVVVGIELPQFIDMEMVEVAPGSKGDTASGGVTTTAVTSTGIEVQVPLFIKVGETIRVETATGSFKERVNK